MTATIAAFHAALVAIRRSLDFHNDYFTERRYKRLLALKESTGVHPQIAAYVAKELDAETFRVASGIKASELRRNYLLSLYGLGKRMANTPSESPD